MKARFTRLNMAVTVTLAALALFVTLIGLMVADQSSAASAPVDTPATLHARRVISPALMTATDWETNLQARRYISPTLMATPEQGGNLLARRYITPTHTLPLFVSRNALWVAGGALDTQEMGSVLLARRVISIPYVYEIHLTL